MEPFPTSPTQTQKTNRITSLYQIDKIMIKSGQLVGYCGRHIQRCRLKNEGRKTIFAIVEQNLILQTLSWKKFVMSISA